MVSTVSRRLGPGGKMYVPRLRYSLTMSFCVVPASSAGSTPMLLGVGHVEPEEPGRRGVDGHGGVHLRDGDPVEQLLHVARCDTGTPTLPTSPAASGASGSYPVWVGRSKAMERPGLPLGEVGAVELVRGPRRSSAPSRCASPTARHAAGRWSFISPPDEWGAYHHCARPAPTGPPPVRDASGCSRRSPSWSCGRAGPEVTRRRSRGTAA